MRSQLLHVLSIAGGNKPADARRNNGGQNRVFHSTSPMMFFSYDVLLLQTLYSIRIAAQPERAPRPETDFNFG
jgi:hypothetical protein